MSGVTDAPFRNIAWRHGAGLIVSEMVASEALATGDAEMRLKARAADAPVHMVQLAGREAKWMSLAAKIAEAVGAAIIDINMGCPAKRVTTGQCGSALMRDPDRAIRLIEAVVASVSVPVTLKMRLGWEERSINAPSIAAMAENAGIAMVTVHGRTRCQLYKGKADWHAVRAVRDQISVPLVVNGDILDTSSAIAARQASGADAVMVGRAAYGAPWLPGQIAAGWMYGKPPDDDRLIGATAPAHYEAMLEFYGTRQGVRQARKHLSWYIDRFSRRTDPRLRTEILTSDCPRNVIRSMTSLFASHGARQAA